MSPLNIGYLGSGEGSAYVHSIYEDRRVARLVLLILYERAIKSMATDNITTIIIAKGVLLFYAKINEQIWTSVAHRLLPGLIHRLFIPWDN